MTISAEKYINPYTDFGFKKLFGTEVNKQEIAEYEDSLKKYRDLYSALDTAERKGMTEGMIKGKIEGKIETALKMLRDGVSIENICRYTDLFEEQVKELIK